MNTKISPTISDIIRIDMDAPKLATRFADFIEANSTDMTVTQVTIYRKMGTAFVLVKPSIKDTFAITELELIVNEFKKTKK